MKRFAIALLPAAAAATLIALGGPATASADSCNYRVDGTENASPGFAANVAAAVNRGCGPGTYRVYSPATNTVITMTCSPGMSMPLICEGGNDARVYLR